MAPALRRDGLRGGLLSWDGQLEDDARLVTTVARTAASYGAHVRTRARVTAATGTRRRPARRADRRDPHRHRRRGRQRRPACGPATSPPSITLRPSRGTHLVLRADTLPGLTRGRHRARPGRDQPLRAGAPAARRHGLRRPHRRAGRRRRSPTCPSRARPRSASCSTWWRRRSPGRCAASDVVGRLRRAPAAARRRRRRAPPTSRASTPC